MCNTPEMNIILNLHLQSKFLLVWFPINYFLHITPFINNITLMAKNNSTEKLLNKKTVKRQVNTF